MPEVETTQNPVSERFQGLLQQLASLSTQLKSVVSEVKSLEKKVQSELRAANKRKARKSGGGNRKPSGFAKPCVISTELCNFLGKPNGTEMARTEVTKYLTTYIKEHKLQDQANRRRILPDKKLGKLLGVGKNDEVTYFNLQKYMKGHFPSSASSASA
tara:strand:+ start:203 stop:676 length:474 start_codon:yes stop_codon:yes gene_type:complete